MEQSNITCLWDIQHLAIETTNGATFSSQSIIQIQFIITMQHYKCIHITSQPLLIVMLNQIHKNMHNISYQSISKQTLRLLEQSTTFQSIQATGTIHSLMYHRYRHVPVNILTSTGGNKLLRARSALRMPTT